MPASRLLSSATPARDALAGTVPLHRACVLLHTHTPPSTYPARSKSPLWRELTLKGRAIGAVPNFAWAPQQEVHPGYAGLGETGEEGEEAYVASVFLQGRPVPLRVPEVTLANTDAVLARIGAQLESNHDGRNGGMEESDRKKAMPNLHLYVCTHGSRDCRCGDQGSAVARALRNEVARRGLGGDVFVGDVAHVGGHKYAANVLVFPTGDWLGTVQDFDAPHILDEILARHSGSGVLAHTSAPPLCPPFWRGRMGLDKDEQLALMAAAS
ncbi:Sucrase/ferredoxin-like-domain-containing protein [Epithele typhae]|uniref:Sucrase/ferredoxin-like-domain-containing protein n=1 Tax=Epithele typhae TaxID=378194 RepID=UPI002008B104|nr:Sucrase/ferredoxin-like-domain-containing protein [Epithele typhae]KAH9919493.1 Sucrase/ferredoxin-like-domain-containing protein [Epithele typhae]